MTPLKAIRAKCLDCSGKQPKEVRECQITSCALWPYRLGHNPKRAGLGGIGQLNSGKRSEVGQT